MATTKTTKKAKKTQSKAVKITTKSASIFSIKSKRFPINDLKKRALDPKNRRSLVLALVVILVAIAVYFGKNLLIAATVNGQPVSRLSVIKDLEKQSGKVVLDSIVTRMLVFQEAAKKNIKASEKDIDSEIAKIKKQFKDQGQDLDALLSTQGLSQTKFREEVRIQILVTKILADKAKVTDKEFSDFLDKNKALVENEKDQKVAKANLKTQMEQQKLAQKYQEWIVGIKKSAKITTFVNY